MEVIENFHKDKTLKLLDACWNLLKPKGRLVIVAPNESAYQHLHQIKVVTRKSLKSLLKHYGNPRLIMQQPYKWLAMYAIKGAQKPDISLSSIRKRLNVMAGLCAGKVIELCCGRGELSHEIRLRGLEVTGVDINIQKIETAGKKYPDITFLCHDILTIPFEPHSFDTVLLPEVLEHVNCETGDRMLSSAWRILKPAGRLIVSVPNENCIPHPNHVRIFTRQSLADILSPYGNPKLVVDQPYKWLIMYIDKPSGN
jgi:2-polyprenyl-3-methyl-5-hydroxy-6-metoxy-1,4-benzoquinol methylase